MGFFSIEALIDGKSFQMILPEIEKEINISDSQLYDIAKVIKEDIENNLKTGRDYMGNAVKPLAQSTIDRKGHARVFFETGDLFKSILYQKVSTNYYEVFVASARDQILTYLQQGNRANNLPSREPFGISKNAENQIDKILTK